MFLELSNIASEGFELDRTFEGIELSLGPKESATAGSVRIQGTGRRERLGVRLDANLAAQVELTCCRCLDPYRMKIEDRFFLILTGDAMEVPSGEQEVPDDRVAMFHATEGKVRVEDICTEQIYLHLPLKPVCREDCAGLCPECGTNRNRETCSCREHAVDPRLAPLLKFRDSE